MYTLEDRRNNFGGGYCYIQNSVVGKNFTAILMWEGGKIYLSFTILYDFVIPIPSVTFSK